MDSDDSCGRDSNHSNESGEKHTTLKIEDLSPIPPPCSGENCEFKIKYIALLEATVLQKDIADK